MGTKGVGSKQFDFKNDEKKLGNFIVLLKLYLL